MKNFIQNTLKNLFSSQAGAGAFVLRVPIGIILAAHGAQKLFGWFGGYGLEGTGQWMASNGFEPGYLMALLTGSAEFFGGIALILGLFVRPAAAIAAIMLMFALTVHIENGLFISNNGYEFALTLLAATITLAIQGAGAVSLDSLWSKRLSR
jgi:putative oxidoreductase